MCGAYFGLAKKLRVPGAPSSILERLETETFSFPSIVPLSASAICRAVNFMVFILGRKITNQLIYRKGCWKLGGQMDECPGVYVFRVKEKVFM